MCQSKTVPEKKYLLGTVLDFILYSIIVKYKKIERMDYCADDRRKHKNI